MIDLQNRIDRFLSGHTYADIHQAMSQAVGLLRECTGEIERLRDAIADLLEPCEVCDGMDVEDCWECEGTGYVPKLSADAVSVAVKLAKLENRDDD